MHMPPTGRSWPGRGVDAGRARERTPRNGQLIGGKHDRLDTCASQLAHRVLRSLVCFGGQSDLAPRHLHTVASRANGLRPNLGGSWQGSAAPARRPPRAVPHFDRGTMSMFRLSSNPTGPRPSVFAHRVYNHN
jgi:hypothetical protein